MHVCELALQEQVQRRMTSAKNCALSFIGGQVSAKQINKIGGEVVPQERSHELQRSLII
jgi:hypothetical protein